MGQPNLNKTYTYDDYLSWEEDVQCEVINGEIINMTPSPTPKHQDIVDELTAEFKMYLRNKECSAFSSPIDVCLFANKQTKKNEIKDWVQPDLIVICDQNKIGEKKITGAPDIVVEVLSPSTGKIDRLIKFNSYEKAGVKEYWIVDPYNQTLEVYILKEGTFNRNGIFSKEDQIKTNIIEGLEIDLSIIFKD